jgi:N-acetylglutamate synthase-like GNAT family acetyltransferase
MKKEIYVRSLERRDLLSIVAMEERITGVARPQYWEQRIELSEAIRPHWTSLVAEFENRFVGFLFGRAGELEFGLPGSIAWVETIGVDPAYRGRGIARELIEEFISSAEDHGIKTIFTLVTSGQTDMQTFFSRQGFAQGKMLHYQKELAS